MQLMHRTLAALLLTAGLAAFAQTGFAAEGAAQGQPPAPVVVAQAKGGMVRPTTEFVGTIYFPEVSEVASEIEGRVTDLYFEEGGHVKKGQQLVRMNADLLSKDLAAAEAEYEQILADLENARKDFSRKSELYEKGTISGSSYDEAKFTAQALDRQASSKLAEAERLRIKLSKVRVPAPFDGVVLEKKIDRGEWLSPGTPVATVARDDYVDVVVNVPEKVLALVRPGDTAAVRALGRNFEGRVFAVIPQGDVATRTFPVKLRVRNTGFLAQGMEARARLPIAEAVSSVLVPRDAVISARGTLVVWTVAEGKAVAVPVEVLAYEGLQAAVTGQGLTEGASVVVKGNERLMPGQAVAPTPQRDAKGK
ncbi:MAG: efflux RND transporter periplasmic adaptor subunit [Desulfovibrionaceae bacterium]|jgi:RND family efflux transporter MFP subunit|nr:efflux RND transporter periplasmic adaptor subunit [Desulfovibrionaceae bacterium]